VEGIFDFNLAKSPRSAKYAKPIFDIIFCPPKKSLSAFKVILEIRKNISNNNSAIFAISASTFGSMPRELFSN